MDSSDDAGGRNGAIGLADVERLASRCQQGLNPVPLEEYAPIVGVLARVISYASAISARKRPSN